MTRLCIFILCVFSGLAQSNEAQLIAFDSSECIERENSKRVGTTIESIGGKVNASFLLTLVNGKVFGDSDIKLDDMSLAIYIKSYRPVGIRIREFCDTKVNIEIERYSDSYKSLNVYLDDKIVHQIEIPNKSN